MLDCAAAIDSGEINPIRDPYELRPVLREVVLRVERPVHRLHTKRRAPLALDSSHIAHSPPQQQDRHWKKEERFQRQQAEKHIEDEGHRG